MAAAYAHTRHNLPSPLRIHRTPIASPVSSHLRPSHLPPFASHHLAGTPRHACPLASARRSSVRSKPSASSTAPFMVAPAACALGPTERCKHGARWRAVARRAVARRATWRAMWHEGARVATCGMWQRMRLECSRGGAAAGGAGRADVIHGTLSGTVLVGGVAARAMDK
jgi:hypothetical protein